MMFQLNQEEEHLSCIDIFIDNTTCFNTVFSIDSWSRVNALLKMSCLLSH